MSWHEFTRRFGVLIAILVCIAFWIVLVIGVFVLLNQSADAKSALPGYVSEPQQLNASQVEILLVSSTIVVHGEPGLLISTIQDLLRIKHGRAFICCRHHMLTQTFPAIVRKRSFRLWVYQPHWKETIALLKRKGFIIHLRERHGRDE